MKPAIALLVLPALAAAADQPNTLTPQERKAGWTLLFDGKTFHGWIDPASHTPPATAWAIEDGAIKATRRPRITEDLVTRETFDDFELQWEWRISEGGNSGIKYRIQDFAALGDLNRPPAPKRFEDLVDHAVRSGRKGRDQVSPAARRGQIYVIGFEYQMIDNARHLDALRGPLYQAGSLYSMIPRTKDTARPAGEWNQSRLVVRGAHIEHWLNGEKVLDAELTDPAIIEKSEKRWGKDSPVYKMLVEARRTGCPLSLQNHDDEAWFRSIKIRRLR
jgi:hypothetical protein